MQNPRSLSDLLSRTGNKLNALKVRSAQRSRIADQVRAALPARMAQAVVGAEIIQGRLTIGVNGAAARLAQKGDLVIIVAYARMEEAEAKSFTPRVLLVDGKNRPQPPSLRVLET